MILGINISSTFQKKSNLNAEKTEVELSNNTMFAVVVGKMILMPVIGILSTWFLEHNYTPFPDGKSMDFFKPSPRIRSFPHHKIKIRLSYTHTEIDATCYLVMMIVFITPTANNVMIMVGNEVVLPLWRLLLDLAKVVHYCSFVISYQVELSGSSSKEGMARLIGWQYAVSPVVLRYV